MSHSQVLFHRVIEAVENAKSEADVKTTFENELRQHAEEAGWRVSFRSEEVRTIVSAGRTDALFSHLVITYEKPGRLQLSNDAPGNRETIRHLTRYVAALAEKKRRRPVGISTDGRLILFLLPRGGDVIAEAPQSVSGDSLQLLLNSMRGLSRTMLSADKLKRDIGPESHAARLGVRALLKEVVDPPRPKVEMMFEEWDRISGIIYGEGIHKAEKMAAALAGLYGIEETVHLKSLLFSIHTYFSLFIKLLAVELLSQMRGLPSRTQELALLDDTALKNEMAMLETGEQFTALGVMDFLDGDLFSWYTDIWNETLAETVRELSASLNHYEPATSSFFPQKTNCLLKTLYRCLIPKKLRHTVSEYCTPDWLAERLLNQVGYEGNPDKRILDPACGSGTFLMLIIHRIHTFLTHHFGRYPDRSVVLNKVLCNVVGFDINPLAVITARTNYLMALGDLLNSMSGEVRIPVYVSDSIRMPSERIELFRKGYSVCTAAGDFPVPSEIVEANQVDVLARLLKESVRLQSGLDVFLERTARACGLDTEGFSAAKPELVELYRTIMDLHRRGRDLIWTGIVKNAFAPLSVGTFDCIVGNPPWANWESLAPEYRTATKALWTHYDLQATSGRIRREPGKQKRDVSLLFIFANIDTYLRERGKLGFVMTQTVLVAQGGEVFRQFRLARDEPMKVVHVDDLVDIQPFEGAANRVSIVVLQKGVATRYPVPYVLWRKKKGERISFDLTLDDVIALTDRANFCGSPLGGGGSTSPWVTARAQTLAALRKIIGRSMYSARVGVCTWANGVYVVSALGKESDGSIGVENLHDIGKKKLRRVRQAVDPALLYPALQARDVSRWQHRSDSYLIIPHLGKTGWQAIPLTEMEITFPKTLAYLREFEEPLANRSGYLRLRRGSPFYVLGNISPEVFATFKVVWRKGGATIRACVVGTKEDEFLNSKAVVPLETVTMVPLERQDEAHFLCAVLNSSQVRMATRAYSSQSGASVGSPHFIRHIAVPRFDPSHPIHRGLAELSLQAHRLVALRGEEPSDSPVQDKEEGLFLREIEEEIDRKAASLWGITDQELPEMTRKLREMSD